MGPVITDEEVKLIDEIAKKHGNHYMSQYGVPRPSLYTIKQLYDTAVNNKPIVPENNITLEQLNEQYAKINRTAVDKLKIIKG
jgi:hypothetical protein